MALNKFTRGAIEHYKRFVQAVVESERDSDFTVGERYRLMVAAAKEILADGPFIENIAEQNE